MKKHSLTALICAICLILTSFILPASALAKGDADEDGKITAADARKVLRHSVNLEQLKGYAFNVSDVDDDDKITAADARLILRASVELEELPECEHTFGKTVIEKKATCAEKGSGYRICTKCGTKETVSLDSLPHQFETVKTAAPDCTNPGKIIKKCKNCSETQEEIIPALGHSWDSGTIITEPTCGKPGIKKCKCVRCGLIMDDTVPPTGKHILDKDAIKDNKLKCTVCGTEGIEIFNSTVNTLKSNQNKYSNFTETTNEFKEPEYSKTAVGTTDAIGLIFKGMFDKEFKNQIKSETTYSDFIEQRLITNDNFPVLGKDFVSSLKIDDIASCKIENIKGIDFVSELTNYTSKTGKNVDLTKLKASAADGSFYKITVSLKDEVFTAEHNENKDSALDRIYMNGYNKQLAMITNKQSMPEIKDKNGNDLVKMDFNITTKSQVVYYLDAETMSPVAAKYDVSMNLINQLNAYFTIKETHSDKPTGFMKLNIITDITDYFFFNDYFDMPDIK